MFFDTANIVSFMQPNGVFSRQKKWCITTIDFLLLDNQPYSAEVIYTVRQPVAGGADEHKGLGRRFEHTVNSALQKIGNAPDAASFAYDTVRYKVVDKFPFIITL